MKQNSSAKNFSYVSIGRITAIGLQAIFYLAFAALLDPETYGQLNYIVALAGTFSIVSRFGLNASLQIFRAKGESKKSDQVGTLFILTTGVAALILLTIDVYAAVLSVASSFFIMNLQNMMGLKQYKKFMLHSILKNILILIIPVLFYFVLDIPGIILGMAISNFLAGIPYFKQIKLKSFFDLRKHYKFLIHNFGADASLNLAFLMDKLLIAPLFGFFIVGIYQFNLMILFALGVIPGILHSFLVTEESSGTTHKKISYLVILGSIAVAVLAIFMAPFLVNEFFPKYSEGILSLQILVLTIIPQSIFSIFIAKLQARESTRMGFSAIVMIVTLMTLIAILGDLYGLIGLSLAVLLATIANVIFSYILYRKLEH